MKIARIGQYLDKLKDEDIYPQSPDFLHMQWTKHVIDDWMKLISSEVHSVLDVGCGEAYAQCFFQRWNVEYTGICLGEDFEVATRKNRRVMLQDFHSVEFFDETFDMVFSRHALEHSPMPIIALMEWYRVSRKYLGLVMPRPDYWGWGGRNHYSVMVDPQIEFLLDRAGWRVLVKDETTEEYRYLCIKQRKNEN